MEVTLELIRWGAVLILISGIGYGFARALPAPVVRGAEGLAPALGFFICAMTAWFLDAALGVSSNALTGWTVVGLAGLASAYARHRSAPPAEGRQRRLNLACAGGLFWSVFAFFLAVRAMNPEIAWGEKPMDSSFLRYFVRLDALPPDDPWASGQRMRYYYLGFYFYAFLHKLSGVSPSYGYNFAMATIPALLASTVFGVLKILVRERRHALFGALAVSTMANLEVFRLWWFTGKRADFDLFWASSRVFHEPGINEYPVWSFLFSDLHAHVMTLPFTVLLLGCTTGLMTSGGRLLSGARIAHRVVCGTLLGALFAFNTWDFISYGGVIGLVFLFRRWEGLAVHPRFLTRDLARALVDGALVAIGALLVMVIYSQQSHSTARVGWDLVTAGEFNSLWIIFRHVGIWIVPLGFCLVRVCGRAQTSTLRGYLARSVIALLFALFPTLLAAYGMHYGIGGQPWGILAVTTVLLFLGAFLGLGVHMGIRLRLAAVMCVAAAGLMSAAELLYLMDRMNTLFKFYNAIWILLGLATFAYLPYLLPARGAPGRQRWAGSVIATALFACGFTGTAIATTATLRTKRVDGPRPTLDGAAYLYDVSRDEAKLIAWMNENIDGTPTILEAWGPSYHLPPYTRVCMHTGLPVYIGWDYHVSQRGTPRQTIEKRKSLVQTIYLSSNPLVTAGLLRASGIKYVVVGDKERDAYRAAGGAMEKGLIKFRLTPQLFRLVFESGNVQLYEVLPDPAGETAGAPLVARPE